MLRQLALNFQTDSRFENLREDLSAACLVSESTLWLASDELPSLERLRWDGMQFNRHESFSLTQYLNLPAGTEGEIDIEGLGFAGHYLWLVGSHSRKIKKPKGDLTDIRNIKRLTWKETRAEPNRYLLGRIPLVNGHLFASCPHPQRTGEKL